MKPRSLYTIAVEDDPLVPKKIAQITGYPCLPFQSPDKLLQQAKKLRPLALFVDIFLADGLNGLDYVSTLKKAWPRAPLLVVTSSTDAQMIMTSLSLGADDFIQKPLRVEELKARLWKQLSRIGDEVGFAGTILDFSQGLLYQGDENIFVSPTEAKLLKLLFNAAGMVLERDQMIQSIWGNTKISTNALDKHISSIRKKLKKVSSQVRVISNYGKGISVIDDGGNKKVMQQSILQKSCPCLLVVDDNRLHLNLVSAMAESLGIKCDTAMDGEEALQLVEKYKYNVILMDMNMPKMNGIEASKKMIEIDPSYSQLIVATSEILGEEVKSRWTEIGVLQFCPKPFDLSMFTRIVEKNCGVLITNKPRSTATINLPENGLLATDVLLEMAKVFEGDACDFILDLLKTYCDATCDFESKIDQDIPNPQIFRAAHKYKGMSENIGALKLAKTLARLEKMAEDSGFKLPLEVIFQARIEYQEVFCEIEQIFKLNSHEHTS